MTWLLLATGFTGALTLVFVIRWIERWRAVPFSVSAHFSPKGGCTDVIVRELQQARKEILILAYSFTSKPIAQAILEARKRGVQIEMVLDRSNEQEAYSDLQLFHQEGLQPLIDAHHAIAHNKVMLIDGHTLITGSFNFTHQAEIENAENLLVIKGHSELLSVYQQNFAVHKAHSQPSQKAEPAGQRRAA
jgi:phosphatidylserine/phosphatidylglycerophosphate/cardiolipin synthase-like enzyme